MTDFDIVAVLRKQAQEIAKANLSGWGNTMTAAADEIERLREVLGRFANIENWYTGYGMPAWRTPEYEKDETGIWRMTPWRIAQDALDK